jgi:tRNA nucleotidyltransferase (CCA-adding enzyme)
MDQVRKPSRAFSMWHTSGAFATLIPALADMHALDLATLDHLCPPQLPARPQRRVMRMIALFAAAPYGEVPGILKGLRFSNADAAWIGSIVGHWQALQKEMRFAMTADSPPSDPVLRRWAAIAGRTRLASVMRVANARWTAERQAGLEAPSQQRVASVYRRAIRIAYRDPIEVGDLAIDGSDLQKLGIRGQAVGQTLRSLLESVINDPAANSRESLLDAARKRVESQSEEDGPQH